MLLVEFSGEHSSLPLAECRGAVMALGGTKPPEADGRLGLVEGDLRPGALAHRLALAHGVHRVILHGPRDEVLADLFQVDVPAGTIKVSTTVATANGGRRIIDALARDLVRRHGVDLERPDHEYRYLEGSSGYLVEVGAWVDRSAFEARKVARRAYHLPISLHPRFARVLVNMAAVAPGHTLLDPFVGTGGIPIEAALVGARPVGGDLRAEAVEGSHRALAALGLGADLVVGDVAEVLGKFPEAEGVATDPPYGRSTTTAGEGVEPLLRRTLRAMATTLRPGTVIAMVLPSTRLVDLAREALHVHEVHALRVHRSLVRHFVRMEV